MEGLFMFHKVILGFIVCLIVLVAACSPVESPPITEGDDESSEQPQETPTELVGPKILSFSVAAIDLTVTLSATTKQGSEKITKARILWGDGQSDEVSSDFETLSLSHSYSDPGIYQVTLELSDGILTSSESKAVSAKLPEPIGERVQVTFERIQVGNLSDCQLFGVFADEAQLSGNLSLNASEVWRLAEQIVTSNESLELDTVVEIDVLYGSGAFVEIIGELSHASNPQDEIDSWSITLPLNDGLYKPYVTDDGTGPRTNGCYAGLYFQIERSGFLF